MEFFTLGGVLSRAWRPAYPLLPWALTSAVLMVLGSWDHMVDGSRVEWTAVGLSAYELMIGLVATSQALPAQSRRTSRVKARTLTCEDQ